MHMRVSRDGAVLVALALILGPTACSRETKNERRVPEPTSTTAGSGRGQTSDTTETTRDEMFH